MRFSGKAARSTMFKEDRRKRREKLGGIDTWNMYEKMRRSIRCVLPLSWEV
jgi:hypothetical protein